MAAQFSVAGKQLVSNGALGLNTANPMSMVGWINSSSWNNLSNPISVIGMYSNPGATGVQIGGRGGDALDVWTWGGGVLVSSGVAFVPTPGYFHVGYTWDGTTHLLYAGGNFIASSVNTNQIAGVIDSVVLNGFLGGGASETSDSIVDELGVYNRVVSANEMKALAQLSVASSGIVEGLVAYYGMDEGLVGSVISTSIDYTGHGNTLVATGTGADETYAIGCSVLERLRVQS